MMDEKTLKEMYDVLEKYCQLEEQKKSPSRDGMIKALLDARSIAPFEIISLEAQQGDTVITPAESFTNERLYYKLNQYQQGLLRYCINKYGEEKIEEYLNNMGL